MKKQIEYFNPIIKTLTPEDDYLVNMFDSGVFAFNQFINKEALNDMNNGDGVTYLVIDKKENELIAYYTISSATISIVDRLDFDDETMQEEEKREHYLPISAFMVAMFAVNEKYQDCLFNGELVSSLILKKIIFQLYEMSINTIGAKRIILCSVPDAVAFYERNNFKKITNDYTIFDKVDAKDNVPMYLTLHDI